MLKKVHSSWLIVHSLFLLFLFVNICFAQPISSSELINNAKLYDGKIVNYTGEVIGDVMKRNDFAWINVNDIENAIGIWLPISLTRDIIYTGSYKSKGDRLEITGIFNRACPEHGGDLDIHAQGIKKIQPGRLINERLNTTKRNFAIVLFCILGAIWILTLLNKR